MMACRTGTRAIDEVTGMIATRSRDGGTGAAMAVQRADMGMESCID